MIYPVDSAIHRLNNWGQVTKHITVKRSIGVFETIEPNSVSKITSVVLLAIIIDKYFVVTKF